MPEEKPATTISSPSPETYKRVYADWKPSTTLEKTDVVGTIEAIEDAQMTRSRDKSIWRKSNLNSTNIPEETEINGRPSHFSATTPLPSAPLQSILEEDRRKSFIQQLGERAPSDRLHIYIRRPSDAPSESTSSGFKHHDDNTSNVTITSDQHSIYIRSPSPSEPKSPRTSAQQTMKDLSSPIASPSKRVNQPGLISSDSTNNKIEIDSDNIETPPVTRRNIVTENKTIANPVRKLQTPRPLHRRTLDESGGDNNSSINQKPEKSIQSEVLGDGQFDRYSVARRTRRYRRPTDYSSGNEDRAETSPELSSPTESTVRKSISHNTNLCLEKMQSGERSESVDRWPSSISNGMDDDDSILSSRASTELLSRVGKVGRNLSSINQEDVQKAIRNLKSPTEAPDRIWSPPRDIVTKEKIAPIKTSNHELNDEGFEETQSLVSDTPSHGKESTSSCTDQPDNKTPKRTKSLRGHSSDAKISSTNSDSLLKKPNIPKSLLERNRQSLERSRSLRTTAVAPTTRTVIPRRTNSLRKSTDTMVSPNKRDVERSGSRTSLRSSRSSLNSATSINTVRNVPLKAPRTISVSLDKALYKKPLILQNTLAVTKPTPARSASVSATSRTPASRSSSSGSSIGHNMKRSQTKSATPTSGTGMLLNSNSYKDHHVPTSTSRPAFRNAVSNSSHSNSSLASNGNGNPSPQRNVPSVRLSQLTKGIVSKTARVSNFMRPTTASATKTLTGPKGK